VSYDEDTCPHLVVLGRLEADNARLKAEVEQLMVFCNCTLIPNKELQAENARLKAEVEKWRNLTRYWSDKYKDTNESLHRSRKAIKEVYAQVERLTKAGDAMASIIKYEPGVNTFDPVPDVVKRWQSAKEGKQP